LLVQGPKSNLAVRDYLRADGPFEIKNIISTPFRSSRERYGLQLNVEIILMYYMS
jgi:hypothetical protein